MLKDPKIRAFFFPLLIMLLEFLETFHWLGVFVDMGRRKLMLITLHGLIGLSNISDQMGVDKTLF